MMNNYETPRLNALFAGIFDTRHAPLCDETHSPEEQAARMRHNPDAHTPFHLLYKGKTPDNTE